MVVLILKNPEVKHLNFQIVIQIELLTKNANKNIRHSEEQLHEMSDHQKSEILKQFKDLNKKVHIISINKINWNWNLQWDKKGIDKQTEKFTNFRFAGDIVLNVQLGYQVTQNKEQ